MADQQDSRIQQSGRLWERPLGVPFADRVLIEKIPDWQARRFYQEHHSYRPELDRVTIENHGVILDAEIVGAITYAIPRRNDPLLGVEKDDMVEVARVCVGVDIPNLASCMLAKSQDRFLARWGVVHGVELLISMVRSDYEGSMFAGLEGKGWQHLREARSGRSGNRDYTGIEDEDKELWVCPVERDRQHQQATLVEVQG